MVASQHRKISYCLYACFLSMLVSPSVSAAHRSTPAKIAVASPAIVTPRPLAESNITQPPVKKTTPAKIRVGATIPSNDSNPALDIQSATIRPYAENETLQPQANRRTTPAKIAVKAPALASENPAVQNPVTLTDHATNTVVQASSSENNSQRQVQPSIIKPYKEGAPIVVVNSAIPSGNEFGVDLMHPASADDIVITDADEETEKPHNAALRTYLSTPSKIPAVSLTQNNNKSTEKQTFDLEASAALIVNQDSGEVLYSKNAQDTVPIASISKLMTAMVVLDAKQSMNEKILITNADVDRLKNTSSRLSVGTKLTRRELLHLALMSSENRAAHALARNYPGGEKAFVRAMNKKAKTLGLTQTHYVEPTGLSAQNRSSPRDLVWLVKTAYTYPLIRQYSTDDSKNITVGKNKLTYKNSNKLIGNDNWNIGLQKTGYIREAGYCMVAQASIAGKRYIMVFLNAEERASRVTDAEKVREIITEQQSRYASSPTGKNMKR